MKKLLSLAFILACASSAFGATLWNPFSTNPASAYPTGGQVPVWGGTAWTFGSGGSATNLSPWSSDINGANFSLTNVSTVSATNITGDSTIARTNQNHFALSVTNFQGITGQGGFIVTNHNAAGVVLNDALTWQGAHVTTTVQDDDQSFIIEPAGSGNLPDFIFYTNGNFRFPGVAINGFGRTLMDTVATTNAFNYLLTNAPAGYPTNMIGVDANGLVVQTNLPTGGGSGSATNIFFNPGQFNTNGLGQIDFKTKGGLTNPVIVAMTGGSGSAAVGIDQQGPLTGPDIFGVTSGGSKMFGVDTNANIYAYIGSQFVGNGGGLSNLNATNITGTIQPANLPSTWSLTTLTANDLIATNIYGKGDGITNASGYHFADTNQLAALSNSIVKITNSIGVSIDGGGASITTGQKGYIMAPINSTIVGWSLSSTSVGDCVVDVWKSSQAVYPPTVANSIAGSALPTLTSTNHYYTNSLAGWSTSVTNGDWFGWNVNSATTISNLTLQIYTVPR